MPTFEEYRRQHPAYSEAKARARFALNERRVELYRLARQAGLKPRDAGHIYTYAELGTPDERGVVREMGPKIQRAMAQAVSERRAVTIRQSPLERQIQSGLQTRQYRFHSNYPTYVKVKIRARDHDARLRTTHMTIVFDELRTPTIGEVMERAHEYLQRNSGQYPWELLSLDIEAFEQVPDRTEVS